MSNQQLKILLEDDYILALYKPSGLVTMAGKGEDSLFSRALTYLQKKGKNSVQLYCAHRLDKDTEGIVIISKGHHAQKAMEDLFKKRKVFKEYIALVPNEIESLFDSKNWRNEDLKYLKILKESGALWLEITHPIYGIKTKSHVNTEKGQPAYTKFCIDGKSTQGTYVRVQLKSGRFHQIRCHLTYLGFPLLGDKLYGSKVSGTFELTAHAVSFTLPINQKRYSLKI